MSNTEYVFVYGTLKRGHDNHRFLNGCTYVCNGYARGCGLVNLGAFPAMVCARLDARDWAEGEIYKLPEKSSLRRSILKSLDALEQEGRLYRRITMEIDTDDGTVECITYLFMLNISSEFVTGGRWRKR